MITLRLHRHARACLDAVAERTDRPLGWILGEAAIEAMRATAHASTDDHAIAVLGPYLASPARTEEARMTTTLPSHCEYAVELLGNVYTRCSGAPVSTAAVVRAAWSRWLDVATVEDITFRLGAVRPATAVLAAVSAGVA
ncbi:hypothetical protein [Rhodococcus pyridinivorans]|uniref:hypothetical protein n=1 Tax=Rhodococcus pyridinivorans TaxID=103816 RepID=UPI000A94C128|nr:hypothetical protein [Rhodococcus pyridinivorans]